MSDQVVDGDNSGLMWVYIRRHWSLFALASVFLMFSSGLFLYLGKAVEFFVDTGLSKESNLFGSLLWLFGVMVLMSIFTFLRYFFISYAGECVVADIRKDLYAHLMRMSIDFFDRRGSADIMSHLSTDSEVLRSLLASSVSLALRNAVLFVGSVLMLFLTSVKLTLCALLSIVPVAILVVFVGKKIKILSARRQQCMSETIRIAEESVSGIRVLQACCVEDKAIVRFNNAVSGAADVSVRCFLMRAMVFAVVMIVAGGILVAVLSVGGQELLRGSITRGQLSSFLLYCTLAATSSAAIMQTMGDLSQAKGSAGRLFGLFAVKPSVVDGDNASTFDDGVIESVEFKNVVFYYPARPNDVALTDFSFKAKKGSKVALVGRTGAGKTTVMQLLLRFYDVSGGCILVNDMDIKSLKMHDLRKRIAWVGQDSVTFSASLEDNLKYGCDDIDDERWNKVISLPVVKSLIDSLPEGLKTFVGEKGVMLSGGQKQFVAIARALLRNFDILLLDEATASLDSKSEQIIQESLDVMVPNCITIVIAHRLSTVLNSDNIVYVDNGRVACQGKHSELMKNNQNYNELVQIQFQGDWQSC